MVAVPAACQKQRPPGEPLIERVVVGSGMDGADNWIAERAAGGGIVITADAPLASRCVESDADASPTR